MLYALLTLLLSLGAAPSCVASVGLPLPHIQESAHIQLFCTDVDIVEASLILQQSEALYAQLSADFQSSPSTKMQLRVYPRIEDFHKEIGSPLAPDWCVGNVTHSEDYKSSFYQVVSPRNPGPAHTRASIMRCLAVGVTELFMSAIFQKRLPRWLYQGVALYKAKYEGSAEELSSMANNATTLPGIVQLESIDDKAFASMHGFRCSYSLVDFICTKWGWETVRALLQDYASFEHIVQLSKDEFSTQWRTFFANKYGHPSVPMLG